MQLLKSKDVEFATQFQILVNERREVTVEVRQTVPDIINDVRLRRNVIINNYTTFFDKFSPDILRLDSEFIVEKAAQCS